jgi:hypothetical protein
LNGFAWKTGTDRHITQFYCQFANLIFLCCKSYKLWSELGTMSCAIPNSMHIVLDTVPITMADDPFENMLDKFCSFLRMDLQGMNP